MTEDATNPAPVSADTGNASFTVSNATPTSNPQVGLADIVPQEYQGKAYLEKIKDIPSLFKSFDHAQEMIGKQPVGVPGENASQDEWNNFYKALGRPDSANGYDIKLPEKMPDGIEASDELMSSFKEFAHELGLTPKQAQALVEFDIKRQGETAGNLNTSREEQLKKMDEEFESLTSKIFGERADEAIENSRKLLSRYAPKDLTEHIKSLDNNSLLMLTSVLDGVTKDYIKEDTPINGQTSPPTSRDELLSEAHKLMQSEAFRNEFNVEHKKTRQRVESIYQQIYK